MDLLTRAATVLCLLTAAGAAFAQELRAAANGGHACT